MSRRPGNGDCRKGTAGADPQWPVHVCRTRLSETVIARAIAENGARRARSGAARSQNAGPVDHLPAAQPSRFVASSRYLTAAAATGEAPPRPLGGRHRARRLGGGAEPNHHQPARDDVDLERPPLRRPERPGGLRPPVRRRPARGVGTPAPRRCRWWSRPVGYRCAAFIDLSSSPRADDGVPRARLAVGPADATA